MSPSSPMNPMTFSSAAPASAIVAPNNTPAGRARAARQPELIRTFSQSQWRARRRRLLITQRVSEPFSPQREIAEVAGPLAARIAALAALPSGHRGPPIPLRLSRWVRGYADAAHELVSTVIGWAAEADGAARTAHLKDEPGKRANAINKLKDLAQRPALPTVTPAMIVDGSWAAALTEMACAADGLKVTATYSDRLERLLLDTVDQAAGDLERKLAYVENTAEEAESLLDQITDADRARAELAALGIETT